MTDDGFRARLIAARHALSLSVRAMAARLLTPRQTYEQWEQGRRRTPGVAVVAAEAMVPRPAIAAAGKRKSHQEIDAAVLRLADGSRNRRQVAEAADLSPSAVAASISRLRTAGQAPKLSRRNDAGRGARYGAGMIDTVLHLADGSRTAREIAETLDMQPTSVHAALSALRARGDTPRLRIDRDRDPAIEARNAEILTRYDAAPDGRALIAPLAAEYGLTKERVRQIIRAAGREPAAARHKRAAAASRLEDEARRLKKAEERRKVDAAMLAAVRDKGLSIAAAGRLIGLSRSEIQSAARRLGLGSMSRHGRWRHRYEPDGNHQER